MSRTYTPNQYQFNTAYNQRILHQNIQDSKVYLSRTSNYLLKAIGDDVVLSGLDLQINDNIDVDTISITILPGLLIQDTTLIDVRESITLTLNLRPYDQSSGYIIVYTSYQYQNSTLENNLQLKMSYITTQGIGIQPSTDIWDPNYNRILLYRFSFTKLPQAALTLIEEPNFTIYNTPYYLKGQVNFTNFSTQILDHASNSSTYGYATTTNAGHIRVGSNLSIANGTLSVQEASQSSAGAVKLATTEEAILMESTTLALTPASIRTNDFESKRY